MVAPSLSPAAVTGAMASSNGRQLLLSPSPDPARLRLTGDRAVGAHAGSAPAARPPVPPPCLV
jgi:hypothetical protein